jgi:hypothetical protein
MNSLKNRRKQLGNMKITSDLTNLTTAILILTVQMFFERTLCIPIVKYFIFVVSMEMDEKNQSHVSIRYLR